MARQNENLWMTPSGKRVWALVAPTYSRWLRQVGGGSIYARYKRAVLNYQLM